MFRACLLTLTLFGSAPVMVQTAWDVVIATGPDCLTPVTVRMVDDIQTAWPGDPSLSVSAFYNVTHQIVYLDGDSDLEDIYHEFGHHLDISCGGVGTEEFAEKYASRMLALPQLRHIVRR